MAALNVIGTRMMFDTNFEKNVLSARQLSTVSVDAHYTRIYTYI